MAKGNKKPNKSKTKKPKKLKPFERPSEGNPDSAAQTPDVYYNNGPGKHNTKGSLFRSKKVFEGVTCHVVELVRKCYFVPPRVANPAKNP